MKKYINPEMIFNSMSSEDVIATSVELVIPKMEYAESGTGNTPLDIGDFLN